jgi:Fe-S-cluster containining protein
MECRLGCAACCIYISISSALPGMPQGKPAGIPCVNLTEERLCTLFDHPERPKVCGAFQTDENLCGHTNEDARIRFSWLEDVTKPVEKFILVDIEE